MKRPNILFLMTDEQKFDTFSYNNPVVKTPNLDKLISESIFFNNAYCSNPSCIPSRAAILTGKYPTVCECPTYITKLPKEEKTFMTSLQEAGYYTAVVGKQHFAESEISHGYDYEKIVDGHSPKGDKIEIKPYLEFLKDNDVNPDDCTKGYQLLSGVWSVDEKYHIDNFVGEEGRKWLENHIASNSDDKPWFFTLSFPGPHMPFDGEGTSYTDEYDLEDMTRPGSEYGDLESKPPHYKKLNPKAYIDQYPEDAFKHTKRSYYANMSLIDNQVGKVIKMLKDTGMYDNTLIIYSTDHGDFMGDFGMVSKAQYLSEGLMHVPLFVKPPIAEFKGYEVNDYVTNIDIASTCLTAAGAEDKISYYMENHPYTDYWTKDKVEPRKYLYMEAHNLKGIIEDGIKVIYYVEREYGELYDLNNDPLERNNLWNDEKYSSYKMKALGRIINEMFRLSPKSYMKWNVKAPQI